MSARKRYGEPLNYISPYERLNTIIRKLSIEKSKSYDGLAAAGSFYEKNITELEL